MKILKLLLLAGIILGFSGCKKFLEEEPTKQSTIKTADQLEALINNATQFANDGTPGNGGTNGSAGFSTDDTEIPLDAYAANSAGKWTIDNLYFYTFKTDEIIGLASDPIWNGEYKKIFTANLILTNLDKVTGDEDMKSELRADAYLIRAYAYWVLVNHFCLPLTATNKNEPGLGLPLKRTTDYEESFVRSTIQEVYDLILADLNEAKKTSKEDVDLLKPWRVSKKGVEAFLSRYYLFLGNYTESLIHTNNALASTNATLVDFHTIVAGTQQNYTNPVGAIINSEFYDYPAAKFLYWKEFYFPRFSYQSGQWLIPSTALRNLYDQANDLRFKWLMLPNSNRRFSIVSHNLYRYAFFSDGRIIPTGPTVAEMLLNKAEILARQNNVGEAMAAVNLLRAKRLNIAAPLTAADQTEALAKVLEERRRELPFSFRWYDIRRFSVNDYPGDDVTVTHTFYKVNVGSVDLTSTQTYTLAPGSKRYAVPINGVEMKASKDEIIQNPYRVVAPVQTTATPKQY
ncbi:MAG: RagB/SusD family nutrient uptake outer membrane protein [Bacteroidota bacterium]